MRIADASVLTDFLLDVPEAVEAVTNGARSRADPLYCPSFTEMEVLSALRGLERGKRLTPARAERAVRDLGNMRLVLSTVGSLQQRIWELRHNLNTYDAAYVALTEQVRDGILLTRDRGLAVVARASLGDARVRLV
ncbi:MAG TPA: type II toxin-antitoxin system VapC family toxin [Baekduia sp.]|uniref:type II toxin-antitoxin system VapC family toxin n=1 Tax=Baekduia sp. TaxID=2600305 RepID=UPI002D79C12A|nr:type II toxin-antitoxin system VapC family toxin [Baekduia sp.]HET6505724.1 type II toxin-antitoxin system VapC family toxin [Baekduia sp.]